MATNHDFLKVVADEKYTFLSTGMTDIKEIELASYIFDDASCPLTFNAYRKYISCTRKSI